MKNILIVTDHFSGGGLETQIINQAQYLSKFDIKTHLATSSCLDEVTVDAFASTHNNLIFSGDATGSDLYNTINTILKIINDHDIDIIHAHPFWSAIVAMPAASISDIPFFYTVHGESSLYFPQIDSISSLLLHSVLLPDASKIYAVSEEMDFLTKTFVNRQVNIVPNSINFDDNLNKNVDIELNKPWMWAGRIDQNKITGLLKLIDFASNKKNLQLHIYGKGSHENEIKNYIVDYKNISYRGWENNIKKIISNYSIICGMGRVVLEAASLNHPCLLVGYDGIKGLLTPELLEKSAYWNISGRGLKNINVDILDVQINNANSSEYKLFEWTVKNRSNEVVYTQYLDDINTSISFKSPMAYAFYESLRYQGENEEKYWESHTIYNHLKKIYNNYR